MKFQVPQFIATETKLIGPFTLKQFLWLGSGGSLIFLLFMVLNRYIFFIVAFPVGAFFVSLAYVKIGEIPLLNYVLYGITYLVNPKRYIFKKEEEGQDLREIIISDENK